MKKDDTIDYLESRPKYRMKILAGLIVIVACVGLVLTIIGF